MSATHLLSEKNLTFLAGLFQMGFSFQQRNAYDPFMHGKPNGLHFGSYKFRNEHAICTTTKPKHKRKHILQALYNVNQD